MNKFMSFMFCNLGIHWWKYYHRDTMRRCKWCNRDEKWMRGAGWCWDPEDSK
jgi:hypothetical protein